MFNLYDESRNAVMLTGPLSKRGYDWWWHSMTAVDDETGEGVPFFIEFFLCNPALGKDEPVLGQDPANKSAHIPPSYLMVKAGKWGDEPRQLHRFFGIKQVGIHEGTPFCIGAADCFCSENTLMGSVDVTAENAANPALMSDAGRMSWNLTMEKLIAFNVGYGASEPLRKANAFEMYWHAQGMKTRYSGTITFDGRTYTVSPEKSYGYADKNWGTDFTSPWVWLSSCHLISNITGEELENSAFDIGGGRPRVVGIPLDRKLLSGLYYEGREYEFNFSKFWTNTKTLFESYETDADIVWDVVQENHEAVIDVHVSCPKRQMLFANYESPFGEKRYSKLWNGGNGTGRIKLYEKMGNGRLKLIDDMQALNIGCEYGEFDE